MLKIFLMWTIFKVFIEFVTILVLFYVLDFWPQDIWDLSSSTRDRTHTPCTGKRNPNSRLPCPSPSPGACSNWWPSSRWCHPTILSLVARSPPAPFFPSLRVFSKESALWIRWPRVLINSCWIGGALQCRGSRAVGLDVAHSTACALVGRAAWGHGCSACSSGEGRAPGEEGRCLEREEEEEGKEETLLSVHFSHSVMSNSLRSHGLLHARPLCSSPTPGVYSNSCPLSRWCHPTHLVLCRPLLLLPSIFPSIRVFSNESALCIRWPKYWSFSFSISPSNKYSGLFSFRKNWLDLLAVQGTLKSLLQHLSSKASILSQVSL